MEKVIMLNKEALKNNREEKKAKREAKKAEKKAKKEAEGKKFNWKPILTVGSYIGTALGSVAATLVATKLMNNSCAPVEAAGAEDVVAPIDEVVPEMETLES